MVRQVVAAVSWDMLVMLNIIQYFTLYTYIFILDNDPFFYLLHSHHPLGVVEGHHLVHGVGRERVACWWDDLHLCRP